jgi:hypothetical protein
MEASELCPDCKETNDYVKLLSSKVNKIEEIVNKFTKDPTPMEIDDPLEYTLYCSWDPMELD